MNEFSNRIRPDWTTSLQDILARAKAANGKGVLAFDLDSTLFDNRPRQALIVREFGTQMKVPELARCDVHHWDSGWDMRAAMRNCGLSDARVEELYPLPLSELEETLAGDAALLLGDFEDATELAL